MSPIPADYVDVAERIRQFKEKHPDGSLQSWCHPEIVEVAGKAFIMYAAAAYRDPEDKMPGIGWAWEPVPGPTPFTRDSELMNAETSAWGRAIVALGFETKKIASANEVRNRQPSEAGNARVEVESSPKPHAPASEGFQAPKPATEKPATDGVLTELNTVLRLLNSSYPEHPGEGRTWEDVAKGHIKDTVQKESVRDLSLAEANELIRWLEDEYQQAAREASIPFETTA